MALEKSIPEAVRALPVVPALDELSLALRDGHAVLGAAPGSGKTSCVPLALRDESWLQGRKILVLEPRRPAARMAARRMASLLGETCGMTVGYQIRFERRIGPATRIEVLTEGVLLRRLQADPELSDVGLIIFDEFHERSLVSDLSLALCLDVCGGLREDLRLLVMSATIDADALQSMLGCPLITAAGREFPVTTTFDRHDCLPEDLPTYCDRAVRRALQESPFGDILIFLPGKREIDRVWQRLAETIPDIDLFRLHGEIGSDQQDRILQPVDRARRRAILATDIAESSLTIPGVHVVIDSGRARKPRFQAGSALTRLETVWISQASAEQRAGRAGRLGPGRCYRLWTAARHDRLEPFAEPEIASADLTSTVLECAAWGVCETSTLSWLTRPPAAAWEQAVELLQQLRALDGKRQMTAHGRWLATISAHPRLAHLLVSYRSSAYLQAAVDLAALLNGRDVVARKTRVSPGVDIDLRVQALSAWRSGESAAQFDSSRLAELDRQAQQLWRQIERLPADHDNTEHLPGDSGSMLALAYPDRIAMRMDGQGTYRLRNGRRVKLRADDQLAAAAFICVAQLDAGQREGRVWLAAELHRDAIDRLFAADMVQRRVVRWDGAGNAIVARGETSLGAIVLESKPVPIDADDDCVALLVDRVLSDGLGLLGGQEKAGQLRARVALARQSAPEDWPDYSDQGLMSDVREWLSPWLAGVHSRADLARLDLDTLLRHRLGHEKIGLLDRLCPVFLATPAGSRRELRYAIDQPPVLAVRLQEMFGQAVSPSVVNGSVPIVIHLLSPAGRPLQITSDLASFWQDGYLQVAKEMRGRYPKHHWPDDPLNTVASASSLKKHCRGDR